MARSDARSESQPERAGWLNFPGYDLFAAIRIASGEPAAHPSIVIPDAMPCIAIRDPVCQIMFWVPVLGAVRLYRDDNIFKRPAGTRINASDRSQDRQRVAALQKGGQAQRDRSRHMPMQRAVLAAMFVAAALSPAGAHHSFTRYDSSKKITISGTVSSVRFQNPHVFFSLETAGGTFKIEAESPSVLRGRGLTDALLINGAKASVTGWRSKSGSAEFGLSSITINGKSFSIRGSAR